MREILVEIAASQAISEVLSICPFIQPLTIANRACKYSHEFVLFYACSFITWRLHPFHAYCIFKDQTSSLNAGSVTKSAPGYSISNHKHMHRWAWLWERPWGLREPVSVYCLLSYLRGIGVVLDLWFMLLKYCSRVQVERCVNPPPHHIARFRMQATGR